MNLRVFWTLVRLSGNRNSRGLRRGGMMGTGRGRVGVWVAYVILLAAFTPVAIELYRASSGLYTILAPIHQTSAEIGVALVAAQLFSLLYGLMAAISIAFFATDLDRFFVLPIRPWMILAARFVSLWMSQLIVALPFVGPTFAAYGVHHGGIGIWIAMVIMYIMISMIPLLIAFLISMLLMRATNFRGAREKVRYFTAILAIVIYVCIRLIGRSALFHKYSQGNNFAALLTQPDGLLYKVGHYFPPSIWETKALTAAFLPTGLLNWVWTLLFTAVLGSMLLLGSNSLFLGGYMGSTEVTRSNGKSTATRRTRPTQSSRYRGPGRSGSPTQSGRSSRDAGTNKAIRANEGIRVNQDVRSSQAGRFTVDAITPRTMRRTLLDREIRQFLRSPAFSLRAFSTTIMMLVVMFFSITQAVNATTMRAHALAFAIGAGCIMMMMGTTNLVAATSFTREGSKFDFIQSLPVPTTEWVRVKWLFADLMSLLPAIVVLVAEVIVRMPVWAMGLSLVLGIVGFNASNGLTLWMDILGPSLDWTNEQQALRGLRPLITIWGTMAVAGGLIALEVWLQMGLKVSGVITYGILLVVLVLLNLLATWVVRGSTDRLYGVSSNYN